MDTHSTSVHDRVLSGFLALAAVITAAFWVTWYWLPGGLELLASKPDDHAYLVFENAFLLADAWMALACLVSAVALWRNSIWSAPWLYMAGSAALYLAGMDILFDIQNGIYLELFSPQADAVVSEIVINIGCLIITAWCFLRATQLFRCLCAEKQATSQT